MDSSLKELSDEDLFLQIAVYDNDRERHLAEKAFFELHRRYAAPLHGRCKKICARLGQVGKAEDLVSMTLARAYERADKYDSEKRNADVDESKCTLAWLSKIARNMLIDHIRNPHRPSNPLEPKEMELEAALYSAEDFSLLYSDRVQVLPTPQHHRLVGEAFESLDERMQSILLETFLQRERTPKAVGMLRGTAKLLADKYQTSTCNIRRIRREGLIEINRYLENALQRRNIS